MTASAWRDNGKTWLASWSGPTRWNDELGVFRANVRGGRLSWEGRDVDDHARVETDDQGLGGMSLTTWLSKKASDADLVVIVVSRHGHGKNPGGGTGPRAEGDDRRPRAPVVLAGTLEEASGGGSRAAGSPGSGTGDADPEAEDADTEAVVGALASGRGHGSGQGSGGQGEGDQSGTGTEDGTAGAAGDGQAGGISAEQGGVGDAYAARVDGQKFGDPEGGRGGIGSRGDAGARGAWALFGGAVNVPRAIRAAVEVALILEDGNLLGLGKDFFKSGVRQFADPTVARKAIAKEARHHAADRLRVIHKELVKTRAFMDLAVEEQKRVLRIAMWEMQVQYFEGVATAVKGQRRSIKNAMKKSSDGEQLLRLNAELAQVEQIAEAVKVKPVAGRLPINHEYAGKRFPDAELDPPYRDKGVRFTKEGFPDFEPHAKSLPNGKKRVQIELTGSHGNDKQKANALFGWKMEPEGYTWHHHEQAGVMLLVPKVVHKTVRHTGGTAIYKHMTGIYKYD